MENVKENKHFIKGLKIVLFLAVIFFFYFLIQDSYVPIKKELFKTNGKTILILFFFFVCYEFVNSLKMKNTVRIYKKDMSLKDIIVFRLESNFYSTITFGSGTWIYILSYFKEKKVGMSETIGINVYQFIMEKIALLWMTNVSIVFFWHHFKSIFEDLFIYILIGHVLTVIIIIGTIALCLSQFLHHKVVDFFLRHITNEKIKGKIHEISLELDDLRKELKYLFHHKGYVLFSLLEGILKHAIVFFIPVYLLGDAGKVSPALIFGLMSCIYMFSGFIPTPSGLGGFDFFYLLLFGSFFGKVKTLSTLLLYRVPTFLCPLLFGFTIFFIHKIKDIAQK